LEKEEKREEINSPQHFIDEDITSS